jgi:alcohol dehydrogenase class IV
MEESQKSRICAFFSPTMILLGFNAVERIGAEAKKLGGSKACIVTDEGVVKAGLIDRIRTPLKKEGIAVEVFGKVEAEPPVRVVDECAAFIRKGKYDLIIGLGGGSSLDTAKAASIMGTRQGSVREICGMDIIPKRGIPKVLIPTTGGTGAEATRAFVVTDEEEGIKKVSYSNYNLPDLAIIDPMLTVSMPPKITADTGIDAFVHAIESFVSFNGTPFSDLLALEAIRLISRSLPTAYSKGEDLSARYDMSFAALFGGMSIASGGLGAVHALAYPIGTEFHQNHGRSNGIILPHVIEFNLMGNIKRYGIIASTMGENIEGLNALEAAERSVVAIRKLLEMINLSYRLRDYGIPKESIPKLVAGGMKQSRLFVPNPRNLTQDDLTAIYTRAW